MSNDTAFDTVISSGVERDASYNPQIGVCLNSAASTFDSRFRILYGCDILQ